MSTHRRSTDVAIESVLRATERTLRRSHEVLEAADATLAADRPWLADVDHLLHAPPGSRPGPVVDLRDRPRRAPGSGTLS